MTDERDWDKLSLDEKLTELGFGTDREYDVPLVSKHHVTALEVRMHAALDQLLDAGGMLGEIEAWTKPTAEGHPTGDEVNTCVAIYELITSDDDTEKA